MLCSLQTTRNPTSWYRCPRTHGPTYCHDINQSVLSLYQLPLNYNGLCITVGSETNGTDVFSMFIYVCYTNCYDNAISQIFYPCGDVLQPDFILFNSMVPITIYKQQAKHCVNVLAFLKKKMKNRTVSFYKISLKICIYTDCKLLRLA